jgi:hypothetical protein
VNITKYEHTIIIGIISALIGAGIGTHIGQEKTVVPVIIKEAAVSKPIEVTPLVARKIAKEKLVQFGWNKTQWHCLNWVWGKESAWNYKAVSPTNDHGIPQRNMPKHTKAQKKAFLEDPIKQIEWGLGYIEHRYSTPCKARAFKERNGWY